MESPEQMIERVHKLADLSTLDTNDRSALRYVLDEAEMARKYRERYGRIDESFFSQLEEWRGRNPIFRTSGGASGGY